MKKETSRKYVTLAIGLQVALAAMKAVPVFAKGDCPKTAILKITSGCNDGSAMFDILGMVLSVVTYGVGAAAIIGVLIIYYGARQFSSSDEGEKPIVSDCDWSSGLGNDLGNSTILIAWWSVCGRFIARKIWWKSRR